MLMGAPVAVDDDRAHRGAGEKSDDPNQEPKPEVDLDGQDCRSGERQRRERSDHRAQPAHQSLDQRVLTRPREVAGEPARVCTEARRKTKPAPKSSVVSNEIQTAAP